jgi:hypothetical protein
MLQVCTCLFTYSFDCLHYAVESARVKFLHLITRILIILLIFPRLMQPGPEADHSPLIIPSLRKIGLLPPSWRGQGQIYLCYTLLLQLQILVFNCLSSLFSLGSYYKTASTLKAWNISLDDLRYAHIQDYKTERYTHKDILLSGRSLKLCT